ncbi:hypothetical protein DL93DRAFT_2089112 [Clavulina sp. PMI_390]|nr:hypothetical protein DL93DRAFT_2089112 [Clavulina sp. PMI_390]
MAPEFVSFANGDTTLRSSDGVDFRVESVYLGLVAEGILPPTDLPLPAKTVDAEHFIPLSETGDVLHLLLALIYPRSDRPNPLALTAAQGEALLRAIDKYDIHSFVVTQFVNEYLTSLAPISVWVLAKTYRYHEAKREAIRRFISDSHDPNFWAIPELARVSGLELANLQHVKHVAQKDARHALGGIFWVCGTHAHAEWYLTHTTTLRDDPFCLDLWSEDALRAIITKEGCPQCLKAFSKSGPTRRRESFRDRIRIILDRAAQRGSDENYLSIIHEEPTSSTLGQSAGQFPKYYSLPMPFTRPTPNRTRFRR